MADLLISAGSVEYLCAPMRIRDDTGTVINPTAMAVEVALPVSGSAPVTWHAGTWETRTEAVTGQGADGAWRTWDPPVYLARLLVGPAVVPLTAGAVLDMYVRVTTGGPETPVRLAGRVRVGV